MGVIWPARVLFTGYFGKSNCLHTEQTVVRHRRTAVRRNVQQLNRIKYGVGILPTCARRFQDYFYYAYVIIDIYSRKIVGWEISSKESEDIAVGFISKNMCSQKSFRDLSSLGQRQPDEGCDNADAVVSSRELFHHFQDQRVSDDNPFIESFFKTVKYTEGYPKYFESEDHVRRWFCDFVDWYNTKHRSLYDRVRNTGNSVTMVRQKKFMTKGIRYMRKRLLPIPKDSAVNPKYGKDRILFS